MTVFSESHALLTNTSLSTDYFKQCTQWRTCQTVEGCTFPYRLNAAATYSELVKWHVKPKAFFAIYTKDKQISNQSIGLHIYI